MFLCRGTLILLLSLGLDHRLVTLPMTLPRMSCKEKPSSMALLKGHLIL